MNSIPNNPFENNIDRTNLQSGNDGIHHLIYMQTLIANKLLKNEDNCVSNRFPHTDLGDNTIIYHMSTGRNSDYAAQRFAEEVFKIYCNAAVRKIIVTFVDNRSELVIPVGLRRYKNAALQDYIWALSEEDAYDRADSELRSNDMVLVDEEVDDE